MTLDEHFIDKKVRIASGSWETPPPSGGWSRIENSLNAQKKHKIVLFRRRLSTVAAVLLAFFAGYFMAWNGGQNTTVISHTQIEQPSITKSDLQPLETLQTSTSKPQSFNLADAQHEPQRSENPIATSITPEILIERLVSPITLAYRPETETTINIPELHIPALFHRISKIEPVSVAPPSQTEPEPEKQSISSPRWSMAGLVGQTIANYYYEQPSSTGSLMYRHDVLESSKQKVTNPMSSIGAEIRYQFSTHWGVSAGIAMHQFATTLSDVQQYEMTTLSSSQPVGNALGQVAFNQKIQYDLSKNPLIEVESDRFKQHLSYIEIPVMATWRVSNQRLGGSINIGIGTNLLTDNTVTLTEESETNVVGHTDGVRNMFVSGIVSMDLILNLHPKWSWSFTPMYRHALQPVSTGTYDPRIISFGLYSGLNYRF